LNNREDDFDNAFQILIINEGGYSNNPMDSGGKTIYGITQRDYPDAFAVCANLYKQKLFLLALDYARRFYKKNFWNDLYKEIPDSSLAFKIFDLSVNRSVVTAVKILQQVLYYQFGKTIKIDGQFGQITLGAIKSVESQEILYKKYIELSEISYRRLKKFWYFGRGWLNRLFRRHQI